MDSFCVRKGWASVFMRWHVDRRDVGRDFMTSVIVGVEGEEGCSRG